MDGLHTGGSDEARQDRGATGSRPEEVEGARGGSRAADGASADGAAEAAAGATSPEPPMHTTMRYSRKRVLILGGAFLAGLVGVVAGLKALGGSAGSAVSAVGDAVKDRFGPFPVRSVDGIDETPITQWTVKVDGMVDTPLTFDHSAWSSLPRLTETVDFHCVEGWTVADVRWGGVAPSVLLDEAGVRPGATYVIAYAESGEYFSTLPLDLMRDAQTVLADTLGGEPLPYDHGGPLRLVVPKQLGYKNVKWVSRLEVTDRPRSGYWESRGYPEDAPAGAG